jgi:Helicase conserved C-terminal domain
MIATGWLGLRSWQELEGQVRDGDEASLALPFLRPAILLWLSALDEDDWVTLDDLAEHLSARFPGWSQVTLCEESPEGPDALGRESAPRVRARLKLEKKHRPPQGTKVLEALLLGAAYPLGLIRVAEERTGRRLAVQISRLGRYALALGPAPLPQTTFEHFLFVQPNFEMIAYRQGLTPQLVGLLSRFATWKQIGSAIELKLTRESIVHGLDRGLTPDSILELLARHSQRALPPGVIDAVKSWSARRERVTFYKSATLIEFGSDSERDRAMESWPGGIAAAPVAVAERFLLVEDDGNIPYDRLRTSSSRDYRRPAEVCMTPLSDGVSLRLDPARADLLVDAELERFADPVESPEAARAQSPSGGAARTFVITSESIRRALGRGVSPLQLTEWFAKRTGAEIPAAVQLLLAATTTRVPPLRAARMVVLNLPNVVLLDGLLEHPSTGPLLGERLGPTSVAIPETSQAALQKALKQLGISLEIA